ncbi:MULTISPECIES: DUF5908 family protein [unclassified Flavobacterium]|uniref:DUF5908 family protein n=1 Tax=unclassified Flavobacterium TaxID=196869 RepID=UPI00209100FB|nr:MULTISPECIES: DUF5908 family protein [unclassified Flavobacterium]MCO6161221.1 DUF5908 family protein [Flavobacterium sp. NRK F7]|tara:strand:- start:477 stop:653 length:177 start_codon:yes stop_codon:yes gene_type:complete
MAIEIKELRIKVTVVENEVHSFASEQKMNSQKWQEMKSAIVKECTSKVLEKIKERSER